MGRKKKVVELPEVKLEDLIDKELSEVMHDKWKRATASMRQRTKGHEFFARISHNQSLFDTPNREKEFSEGSTQAIKRKIRNQTIQRQPDGEIISSYDKNSIEQVELEFLFEKKIMTSEYQGKDMLKNLWRTFNIAYDHGFACVRTGFEADVDEDIRVTYKLINWNDVYPEPDCDYVEEAEWYIIREYLSKSDLCAELDADGNLKDSESGWNADALRYIKEKGTKDAIDPRSNPLADSMNSKATTESVEVWTLYKRGQEQFKTFCPSLQCCIREVKNYDPRKDIPLHFLILEPDAEFPLGVSQIIYTLPQQQFADAFQTLSYQTLLLAVNPPLMGFGNLTPSTIKMKPRAFWNMGTNPNNKVEPFRVETSILNNYSNVLQNISANMMKNLNVTDNTVASDAHTANYSATPQGVQQQQKDKTITINQFQKRMEIFFGEWANHALRSYINVMAGEQELTVDEKTRRRIWDIEQANKEPDEESIVNGDKIKINFDDLSVELLSFEIRTGSLVENEQESERKSIQELIVPLSQMLGNLTEENRKPFEQNIMQLSQRLCELSNVDISVQTASRIDEQLISLAMQATMEKQMQQEQQIQQIMQALGAGQQEQMPPEGQPPQEQMPPEEQGGPAMVQGVPEENPETTMQPQQEMPPQAPIQM